MTTSSRTEYMDEFRKRQRDEGVRRVNVTLSADEFERINASAEAHGERVTTHLKSLAIAQLDRRYLVPPDMLNRFDSLVAIMRGIGNNLNQLARHSNEMHYFLETESVRMQIQRMEESLREYITDPDRVNSKKRKSDDN